jgi:internalin A
LFWNPRLSEERVIVGQQWALNGIYAALERRKGFPVYKALISRRGRFTVMDLPEESWQNRPEEERRMLVSFMRLTGVCFPLVSREESYWSEEVLVSIAHLRDFEALGFEQLFSDAPGSENEPSPVEIKCHFLHRGHWNAILASLGGYYGTTAEYGRDGFWLPANKNQQSALIRCEIDEEKGIGGVIWIRVKGLDAGDFICELKNLVEANLPAVDGVRRYAPLTRDDRLPEKIKVFFSYTWNPKEPTDKPFDYEKPVDTVYAALASETSLELLRDKYANYNGKMRLVSDFLDELKKSDKMLVFHSPKYWESYYCMWEMYAVQMKFQNSPSEPKSCLLFVEAARSVFGDGDDLKTIRVNWEKRCKDQAFEVPTWMTSFNPPVTGRDDMWHCAKNVLDWVPHLADPKVPKIPWDDGQKAQLIAQIKEFLLSAKPAALEA